MTILELDVYISIDRGPYFLAKYGAPLRRLLFFMSQLVSLSWSSAVDGGPLFHTTLTHLKMVKSVRVNSVGDYSVKWKHVET